MQGLSVGGVTLFYNCWWYSVVQGLSVVGVTLYIVIIAGGTAQCKVLLSVV